MTARPSPSGFAEPVLNAQAVFRAVMGALARPGTIQRLDAKVTAPEPLTPELAAIALAMSDHETPVWLAKDLARSPQVVEFLRFHTGAPVVEDPGHATFALATAGEKLPPLDAFAQGTDDYPDRSTTLILAVTSLRSGSELTLEGPGIKGCATLQIEPLPPGIVGELAANRARFPRGVDCLFVASGEVAALPRTTRVSGA